MPGLSRRRGSNVDIWPGFVDALATLLMVIIFLLLVFVIAQFYLGAALSGRDKALDKLNQEVAELAGCVVFCPPVPREDSRQGLLFKSGDVRQVGHCQRGVHQCLSRSLPVVKERQEGHEPTIVMPGVVYVFRQGDTLLLGGKKRDIDGVSDAG